jgi:hypothetical protein
MIWTPCQCLYVLMWKGKYQSTDNTKNWKRKRISYLKNEEISRRKAYTNTRKLNWNILTITDIFPNQKRVNVCEQTVKVIVESFQLSFHVFVLSFFRRSLLFLRDSSFFSNFFVYPHFDIIFKPPLSP